MPATLFSEAVSGLKWVSVFPTNAAVGEPNVTGVMLLSEIKTGFPIALIDGTLCTKIRTAAVGCVAAKYLAPSKVKKVGFIGAGEEVEALCFTETFISNKLILAESLPVNLLQKLIL